MGLQSWPGCASNCHSRGLLPHPSTLSAATPEAGEWAAGCVSCMSGPDASLCFPTATVCPQLPAARCHQLYTIRFLTSLLFVPCALPSPVILHVGCAYHGGVAQNTQRGSPFSGLRTGGPAHTGEAWDVTPWPLAAWPLCTAGPAQRGRANLDLWEEGEACP